MDTKRLLSILGILGVMVVLWAFTRTPDAGPTPEATAAVETLPATPTFRGTSKSAEAGATQAELASLREQLLQAQDKLAGNLQTLTDLKKQSAEVQERPEMSNSSQQISAYRQQIRNIIEDLADSRGGERDINASASAAMQEQDNAARVAREQVDAAIAVLTQDIQRTQADLYYWQNYPVGTLDVGEQRRQLAALQEQMATQQEQLSDLREQRIGISAAVLVNHRDIQDLSARARDDLRSSNAQARRQIASLQSEIARLQQGQSGGVAQRQGLSTQISQAQKDLDAQSGVVQSLQQQIRERESALR